MKVQPTFIPRGGVVRFSCSCQPQPDGAEFTLTGLEGAGILPHPGNRARGKRSDRQTMRLFGTYLHGAHACMPWGSPSDRSSAATPASIHVTANKQRRPGTQGVPL